MNDWAIPFAALIIAVATLVATRVDAARAARKDTVDEMSKRLDVCMEDKERMMRENLELRQQLFSVMLKQNQLERKVDG